MSVKYSITFMRYASLVGCPNKMLFYGEFFVSVFLASESGRTKLYSTLMSEIG
jgi:hypothetical protein